MSGALPSDTLVGMSPALSDGYDLLVPARVVFGWGRRSELGRRLGAIGRRAFVVRGARSLERAGVFDHLREIVEAAGVEWVDIDQVHREPLVEDVDCLAARLRERGPGDGDVVVGIGGGAALDLAKAGCAMATNRESATVRDYLEGVGSGLALREAPLPFVAVPTTAGTGSEATRNAVISQPEPPFKKSLRSDLVVARVALIDPELTVAVPAETTANTGMDAITQLIESYISTRARPVPRALALDGLRGALAAVHRAVADPTDRRAREVMAHAAFLSGVALANSGLGMAHGVAAALGIHCAVPHGLACAVMLPAALRANRAVRRRDLAELAAVALERRFESEDVAASALIDEIDRLCDDIGIPRRLGVLGVTRERIPALVASSRGNSMSGNPRELSDEELGEVLEAML